MDAWTHTQHAWTHTAGEEDAGKTAAGHAVPPLRLRCISCHGHMPSRGRCQKPPHAFHSCIQRTSAEQASIPRGISCGAEQQNQHHLQQPLDAKHLESLRARSQQRGPPPTHGENKHWSCTTTVHFQRPECTRTSASRTCWNSKNAFRLFKAARSSFSRSVSSGEAPSAGSSARVSNL